MEKKANGEEKWGLELFDTLTREIILGGWGVKLMGG